MRDGSYYEGEFTNGEIDGTGCRFWAHSGNYYEGQFEKGEINGKGVMQFGNGHVYEGTWADNKMEGKCIDTFVYCDNSSIKPLLSGLVFAYFCD